MNNKYTSTTMKRRYENRYSEAKPVRHTLVKLRRSDKFVHFNLLTPDKDREHYICSLKTLQSAIENVSSREFDKDIGNILIANMASKDIMNLEFMFIDMSWSTDKHFSNGKVRNYSVRIDVNEIQNILNASPETEIVVLSRPETCGHSTVTIHAPKAMEKILNKENRLRNAFAKRVQGLTNSDGELVINDDYGPNPDLYFVRYNNDGRRDFNGGIIMRKDKRGGKYFTVHT